MPESGGRLFDIPGFLRTLTEAPGVYRMLGKADEVLYVGKAKNLKRRVSSYFQRTSLSPRIQLMVGQISRVEVTVTRSEGEALLLENNQIKGLAPRFNILFRDDKSYPYILFTGETFPQIRFYRGKLERRHTYFGPFPNTTAVRESIAVLQRVFMLRTCEDSVFRNRSRPCLLHQIKRCKAPCVNLVSAFEYADDVNMARMFLRGRHTELIEQISRDMHAAAESLAFEKAALLRDQIRMLHQVLQRHYVESATAVDTDVIAAVEEGGVVCINLAMIRGRRHLGDRAFFPGGGHGADAGEALAAFLEQHYTDHPIPQRVAINISPDGDAGDSLADLAGHAVTLGPPSGTNERAWMEQALKNARTAIQASVARNVAGTHRLEALCRLLGLEEADPRIECFDVSHTMGEATVASCVVFDQGAMQKGEYRRFNLSVTPGDDYAGMREVLTRRYQRVVSVEGQKPTLVLIDGGKGQVGVAAAVFAELGLNDVLLVGVAKGEERKPGMEELVFADNSPTVHLESDAPALHLIQQIRDEAHRFAVAGHRARRAAARSSSRLEDIPGIGPTRRKRLLGHFGGLQGLLAASVDELRRVEGINHTLAEEIYRQLH